MKEIDKILQEINRTTDQKEIDRLRRKLKAYIDLELNLRKLNLFDTEDDFYKYINNTL